MGSSEKIRIRDATELDRESILAVMLEAYEQYRTVLPPARWEPYRESIRASVDGDGPAARIVAELAGKVVGSVQLFLSSDAAYGMPELGIQSPIIRFLSVSPAARGRGIATLLIQESAKRSLAFGAATLHLHTSDIMESAVKLYERLGFERAFDKDMRNGDTLVKSYRIHLKEAALL